MGVDEEGLAAMEEYVCEAVAPADEALVRATAEAVVEAAAAAAAATAVAAEGDKGFLGLPDRLDAAGVELGGEDGDESSGRGMQPGIKERMLVCLPSLEDALGVRCKLPHTTVAALQKEENLFSGMVPPQGLMLNSFLAGV